jgi:hypothetical protein
MLRAIGLALGLAAFAHAVSAHQRSEVSLADLTMAKGLPADCTLVSFAPQDFMIGRTIPDISCTVESVDRL